MSPFCPRALAGAISSCALSAAVETWLQVTMETLQNSCAIVINKYHCLKSHGNTQTLETDLCVQMKAQKSIAKQEFPLCCNLSHPQVIQSYYRWPRLQRCPLPILPGFSLTQEKGCDNLLMEQWKCLCLLITSIQIHGTSVFQPLQTKRANLAVFERYIKENWGSRVEGCEILSILLVTLACHCPLNVTSSRAQLHGSKKHLFLLYQNTQFPETLKDWWTTQLGADGSVSLCYN